MKKLVAFALTAALAFATPFALTACGQKGGTDDAATTDAATEEAATTDAATTDAASEEAAADEDVASESAPFATLGDVFAEDTEGMSSTFDDQRYVCAFNWDGAWWRIEADLNDGMYDELNDAWAEDQNKVNELLSPLAVTKTDVLEAPDAETLEALAGKTGADLTADGFTFTWGTLVINGEETDCVATKGDFDFLVTFDSAVADENAEDVAAAVADMTVSSVSIQGVSWNVLEG